MKRRTVKWSRILALCLSLCLSASLWAQDPPSSSTDSPPGASAATSTQPASNWDQLDSLLTQLEQAATDSQANSQQLRASLAMARDQLTQLSQALAASQTQMTDLSSSLAQSEASLQASDQSLQSAQAEAKRRNAELWIWRGATVAASILAVLALVGR